MTHDITINADGVAEAAFAGKEGKYNPAWHGLGELFTDAMTSAQALEASHNDWRVVQEYMYTERAVQEMLLTMTKGHAEGANVWSLDFQQEMLKLQRGKTLVNIREDTRLELGVVTKQYKVVQNREAFEFLDSLVEEGEMQYESCFSLGGGKEVVILARMPQIYQVVSGDIQLPYILFNNCHDGTGAIQVGPCMMRAVCKNTKEIALQERTNGRRRIRNLSIPHKGKIQEKLETVKTILFAAQEKQREYNDHCVELASRQLTTAEWMEYLDIMCPQLSVNDPDYTERRARKIDETREAIRTLYHGPCQQTAPQTAWAAYNAVTEHIDHLPRRGATAAQKAEARFNVTMYGPGRDMKERAYLTACRFAGLEFATQA